MPNNAFRFNVDTPTAYRIRQAALLQNRSVADVIRRAVELHVDAPTAVAGDAIATDEGQRRHGSGKMTGAYLSGPLAQAVRDIAEAEGRSQSNVVRALIRESLQRRGLLQSKSIDELLAVHVGN